MKTIVSLIAAVALSLGLVSFAGPATAAYPASIDTYTRVTAPATVKVRTALPLTVAVKPVAGNGKPTGTISFTFKRGSKVVRQTTRAYAGGTASYSFRPFAKGVVAVRAVFKPAGGSVYKASSDFTSFTVVR